MFLLRSANAIHSTLNSNNLSFSRTRHLRKIVRAYEAYSNVSHTGDVASNPQYEDNAIRRLPLASTTEFHKKSINPFQSKFDDLKKPSGLSVNHQMHKDPDFTQLNATPPSLNIQQDSVNPFKSKYNLEKTDDPHTTYHQGYEIHSAKNKANNSLDMQDASLQPITSNSTSLTEIENPHQNHLPSPFGRIDSENPPELVRHFPPTFNLSAYVNESPTLQQLIKLGVDLSKIEKRKGLPQFILKLDFEKDMKSHLSFLNDLGISPDLLGDFLTTNPLIFKEDLGDLEVRVNYLEVKKFKEAQIVRIVTTNPFWLMYSTKRIDKRLGYFQKNFGLSGDDIRFLATKQPRLITYNMAHVRHSTFCIREEMGFDKDEVKCLLLSKPKLWMMDHTKMTERFEYIHQQMNISHHQIIQFPEILICRLFRLKERHGFLKYLGKAQYDPSKDLYVSLKKLVEGSDREFVIDVAKSSIEEYNAFLRSS